MCTIHFHSEMWRICCTNAASRSAKRWFDFGEQVWPVACARVPTFEMSRNLTTPLGHKNDLPVMTKKSSDVTKFAIANMRKQLDSSLGRKVYADYIVCIEHIKWF